MAARLLLLATGLLAAATAACVQDDGSRWSLRKMVAVSEDDEREAGAEFDAWARANLPVVEDPIVMGFVNDLGQAMVRTIEPQPFLYRFRVVRDPRLNAFAVPGGYIYFHSQTLLAASTLDEVAGVMGHEIAHVRQRHYARGVEANAIPSLLIQAAAIGATAATGHPAPMIVGMGLNVAFQLKYSRAFEDEADRYGAVYTTRLGYDPRGMTTFFQRILAEEKRLPPGIEVPPYLYTHPDVEDRIEAVRADADRLRRVRDPDRELTFQFHAAQARLALLEATGRLVWRALPGEVDRKRSDPALQLAAERAERGDVDGALAVLRGAEATEPLDPRMPFRRGELLEQTDRMEEAALAYRRAVELDPTTGLVLYKLGRAYAVLGDRHRAAYYLDQSVLHLRDDSAAGRAAQAALELLTFPVVGEGGVADQFEAELGLGTPQFTRGERVVWWARIGPRHAARRDEIQVRWTAPDGTVTQEEAAHGRGRLGVESQLALAAASPAGVWSVEARLEGAVVDRHRFEVR